MFDFIIIFLSKRDFGLGGVVIKRVFHNNR